MPSIFELLSAYFKLIESLLEHIGRRSRNRKARSVPIGETLQKVELAQEHLTEAIAAIDVIREQVVSERGQLDSLLAEVEKKKQQYREATQDLETTQNLLEQDQDRLRTALGVNTSKEKIVGFVSGVIASILATALWVFGTALLKIISSKIQLFTN